MSNQVRFILAAGALLLLPACARKAPAKPAVAAAAAEVQLTYEQRLGKAVFQHYCLNCHGEQGAGDGFNAFNIDPHPRDLSDPAFQKAKTDDELADTVRRGGAGVGLSPFMPPWGKTLSADEVDQVVSYVRTLNKPPDAPPAQP
ncbi:MAG TPA: cytochrome c [Holophagaceae bacterium]|nr:cytochrome c [Holophagaceae bacterium]